MLILLWCIAGLALVLAGAAWVKARQLTRELADLSRSYWQLRYEHGQLASRVHQLEAQNGTAASQDEPSATVSPGPTAFVPLSSLKRTS